MATWIKTRRSVPRMLLLGCASLALTGCNSVRMPLGVNAHAPGMGGDGARPAALRNVANPNAPYTLAGPAPQLKTRAAVLDIHGVAPCTPVQLSAFESAAEVDGPRHTLRFTLVNAGSPCRLGGFPSISLLRGDGSVLGSVEIRKVSARSLAASLAAPRSAPNDATLSPSPQVLLVAGGEAVFQIGWIASPTCDEVSRIAISAPGSTRSLLIPRQLEVCDNQLLVTAVASPE